MHMTATGKKWLSRLFILIMLTAAVLPASVNMVWGEEAQAHYLTWDEYKTAYGIDSWDYND